MTNSGKITDDMLEVISDLTRRRDNTVTLAIALSIETPELDGPMSAIIDSLTT